MLNLADDALDPLVGALTLAEAGDRLRDGLSRLPELAGQLEHINTAMAVMGVAVADEPVTWFLDLDHTDAFGFTHRPQLPGGPEGDLTGVFAESAAAEPLSQILGLLELDPLTVADDPRFFKRLAAQPNLPDYMKEGVARLHG